MKIAIDLTALYGRRHTGVELYAIDLYRALLRTGHTIIPIFHVENKLDQNENAILISKSNRFIIENIKLTGLIKRIRPDIALFPIFPPPFDIYDKGVKIVPTLHDFAFVEFKDTLSWKARLYLIPKCNRMLQKSHGIITISETTKKKLLNVTDIPIWNLGENIASEYAQTIEYKTDSLSKWGLTKDNYIISVSTIEPRKNLRYLLELFKTKPLAPNQKLVLVGRKGWGKDNKLRDLIESYDDKLIFTEYVSLEELKSLYHYAKAFALLSLDEGFGRTPFEAVACGCKKIILSDIAIFRETFDGNATFLPLNDLKKASEMLDLKDLTFISDDFSIPFNVIEERLEHFLSDIK